MKKCPQCQTAYFDEMLEFCLEDGAKLSVVNNQTTAKTEVLTAERNSVETVFVNNHAAIPKTFEVNTATAEQRQTNAAKISSLKQNAVEKGHRTLEIGTLIFALAHNWLQWLYVDRHSYGTISEFLLSSQFLIWLLLLIAGTISGVLTIKFSPKKNFAYIGLVILAINFLLLLVPRR